MGLQDRMYVVGMRVRDTDVDAGMLQCELSQASPWEAQEEAECRMVLYSADAV